MDKISGLSDELLVKILSFVPTKLAVSTSLLSKRWERLWMWLPKLQYKTETHVSSTQPKPPVLEFVDKKLPLHKAQVIESLHLRLGFNSPVIPGKVKRWVEIAVSRHVRELKINYRLKGETIFPASLFACATLVILKLKSMTLVDAPSMVCLPSLKTLQLIRVTFGDGDSLQRLLSVCPILEDLMVFCDESDYMKVLAIKVPSLQILILDIPDNWSLQGYVIDTPFLKYLKLDDWHYEEHYAMIKNMPMLREAYIVLKHCNLRSVIGSITSVKRLSICSEDYSFGDDMVFNELEHLSMCVCEVYSSNLLGHLLKDTPSLRVLDICSLKDHEDNETRDMVCWNKPSHVPECLSSVEIFNWSRSFDRAQDKDIIGYILENARHLKRATLG